MEYLISTDVEPGTCRRCGAHLLVAHVEGLTARVDAHPINPTQEIAALLAGKWTYTHDWKQLFYRDAPRIRSGDPGPIHAEHRCPPAPTPVHQLDIFGSLK